MPFDGSFLAPTKLVALSDQMCRGFRRVHTERFTACKKAVVDRSFTRTAFVAKQMNTLTAFYGQSMSRTFVRSWEHTFLDRPASQFLSAATSSREGSHP